MQLEYTREELMQFVKDNTGDHSVESAIVLYAMDFDNPAAIAYRHAFYHWSHSLSQHAIDNDVDMTPLQEKFNGVRLDIMNTMRVAYFQYMWACDLFTDEHMKFIVDSAFVSDLITACENVVDYPEYERFGDFVLGTPMKPLKTLAMKAIMDAYDSYLRSDRMNMETLEDENHVLLDLCIADRSTKDEVQSAFAKAYDHGCDLMLWQALLFEGASYTKYVKEKNHIYDTECVGMKYMLPPGTVEIEALASATVQ